MAPSDFYLFPKLKSHLRGTQYGNNEGVIEAVKEYFWDQENTFYFEGIRKLEQRWAKCIAFKEIIVKSNGQIFIPWKPKVQGADNFLIISVGNKSVAGFALGFIFLSPPFSPIRFFFVPFS